MRDIKKNMAAFRKSERANKQKHNSIGMKNMNVKVFLLHLEYFFYFTLVVLSEILQSNFDMHARTKMPKPISSRVLRVVALACKKEVSVNLTGTSPTKCYYNGTNTKKWIILISYTTNVRRFFVVSQTGVDSLGILLKASSLTCELSQNKKPHN